MCIHNYITRDPLAFFPFMQHIRVILNFFSVTLYHPPTHHTLSLSALSTIMQGQVRAQHGEYIHTERFHECTPRYHYHVAFPLSLSLLMHQCQPPVISSSGEWCIEKVNDIRYDDNQGRKKGGIIFDCVRGKDLYIQSWWLGGVKLLWLERCFTARET